MDVRITGAPDAGELAAVLAVLDRRVEPAPRPLDLWRTRRREALSRARRTAQHTR